eukprot:117982_1
MSEYDVVPVNIQESTVMTNEDNQTTDSDPFGWIVALISMILSMISSIMITIKISTQAMCSVIFFVAIFNIVLRIWQATYLQKKYYSAHNTYPQTKQLGNQIEKQYITLLATYSECSFDILQAAVLSRGLEYESAGIFVIIATWIGFGEEGVDLIEEYVEKMADTLSKRSFYAYTVVTLIMIIGQQVAAFYIRLAHWLGIAIMCNSACVGFLALSLAARNLKRCKII